MNPLELSKESFNLNYSFNENLLEVVENAESVAQYCEAAVNWLDLEMNQPEAEWDVLQMVSVLGEVAVFQKMLGDFESAEELIEAALDLVSEFELAQSFYVQQILRKADIFRYQKKFNEAEELFEQALHLCLTQTELKSYLDFSYQHLGKLYFDQQQYQKALGYFEKALELRKTKADENLIHSSEWALQTTLKKFRA